MEPHSHYHFVCHVLTRFRGQQQNSVRCNHIMELFASTRNPSEKRSLRQWVGSLQRLCKKKTTCPSGRNSKSPFSKRQSNDTGERHSPYSGERQSNDPRGGKTKYHPNVSVITYSSGRTINLATATLGSAKWPFTCIEDNTSSGHGQTSLNSL